MTWIAPSEKDSANATLEKRLLDAADQFRAHIGFTTEDHPTPAPGITPLPTLLPSAGAVL